MSYNPPPLSTSIPHPRLPSDILLRSLATHAFAATAYAHLLTLLAWRKPHGAPLHPALILAFALMPELLLLQLAFWLLPVLFARPWRRMVVARFQALPNELVAGKGLVSPARLLAHALFAAANALPLAAVLGAYRQRLGMTFHSATYVANLGLDHRNGWAAIGGLVAAVAATLLSVALVLVVALGAATKGEAVLGVERSGTVVEWRDVQPERTVGWRGRGRAWWLGLTAEDIDWPALSEAVYTTLIHQILLAVTNHPVPVMVILRAWYLWPVVGGAVYWLHVKRGVKREVLGLGAAVVFVAISAGVQIFGDGTELWNVYRGVVQPWNYRWAVRDWFSAKSVESES